MKKSLRLSYEESQVKKKRVVPIRGLAVAWKGACWRGSKTAIGLRTSKRKNASALRTLTPYIVVRGRNIRRGGIPAHGEKAVRKAAPCLGTARRISDLAIHTH